MTCIGFSNSIILYFLINVRSVLFQVINAVGEIYDLLQTAPPKGPVNNYDPNFADEFNSQNYGGFTMGSGGRGGGRGGMRGGSGGGGGSFGGRYV